MTAVPEIGPLLGRMADPAAAADPFPVDDIRFALVTELFELTSVARQFAAAGDIPAAAVSLGRHGWLDVWERAVSAVAARVAERIETDLRAAAAESRIPDRLLRRSLLDDEERRGIGLRLGVTGGPFVAALDALEWAGPAAARSPEGLGAWRESVTGAARRVETAWAALVAAAGEEQAAWRGEIERVRSWRRPRWPLWLISLVVVGVALWLGLIFGGFIDAPAAVRPLAELWWRRL